LSRIVTGADAISLQVLNLSGQPGTAAGGLAGALVLYLDCATGRGNYLQACPTAAVSRLKKGAISRLSGTNPGSMSRIGDYASIDAGMFNGPGAECAFPGLKVETLRQAQGRLWESAIFIVD
jgi:hypothetical protein